MDLQSFAIGIVTMVVFALAIITVIGILKVTALAKNLVTLTRRVDDDSRELSREINSVEQTVMNQISHVHDSLHRCIEESERSDRSYTDHRIDKLIDTYFEHKNLKKQVLKD